MGIKPLSILDLTPFGVLIETYIDICHRAGKNPDDMPFLDVDQESPDENNRKIEHLRNTINHLRNREIPFELLFRPPLSNVFSHEDEEIKTLDYPEEEDESDICVFLLKNLTKLPEPLISLLLREFIPFPVFSNLIFILCEERCLDSLKIIMTHVPEIRFDPTNLFLIFSRMCEQGELEIAKWLKNTFNVDHTARENTAFKFACSAGQTHVIEWLYKTYPDCTSTELNTILFGMACARSDVRTAQILKTLDPNLDHKSRDCIAFRSACSSGRLSVAKWLKETYPDIDVRIRNDRAFRGACSNDRLEVARWLLMICPEIDTRANDDYAMRQAKKRDHTRIMEWLSVVRG